MEIRNIVAMNRSSGKHTLAGELPEGKDVVRDPYVYYKPEETLAGTTVGYAFIYPGCKAGGHYHESVEEIYHVVRGQGKMNVGDEAYTINEGDTFLVPLFKWHSTENTGNSTLELFWVLVPVKTDNITERREVVGVPLEVDRADLEKYKR